MIYKWIYNCNKNKNVSGFVDVEEDTTHAISDNEGESTTAAAAGAGRAGDGESVHTTKESTIGEPSPSLIQQCDLMNRYWTLEFAGKQLTLVEKLQAVKENRRRMELNYISGMIQQLKKDETFLYAMESKRILFEC